MQTLKPIGWVCGGLSQPPQDDWKSKVTEVKILPEWAEGLRGLDQFSHVVVVYVLTRADFDPAKHLVSRPFHQPNLPLMGVFARRAKERPNPIGVTTVRLLKVFGEGIIVEGLDAIEGTPVLDLKPYDPVYDDVEGAVVPSWVYENLDLYVGK